MKTEFTFLMSLAIASVCAQTISAEEALMDLDGDGYAEVVNLDQLDEASLRPVVQPAPRLCGGADDDQLKTGTALCGGADDDQIVGGDGADFLRLSVVPALVSDPLGLVTSPQGSFQTQSPQTRNLLTSVQGPYQVQGQMTQTNGLYTSVQYPYTLASVPQISGGNGNDSITGDAGNDTISGGSLDNLTVDRMILQLMTTGSFCGDETENDLWGGGGTDEKNIRATDGIIDIESDPFGIWIEFTGLQSQPVTAPAGIVIVNPADGSI